MRILPPRSICAGGQVSAEKGYTSAGTLGKERGLPGGVNVPETALLPVTLPRRRSGEEESGQQKGKVASQGPVNREEVGRETLRGSKVGKQMHMGCKTGTRESQGLSRALVPIGAWCSEVRLSHYNRVRPWYMGWGR